MNLERRTVTVSDNQYRLCFELLHRSYPDSTDYWDGNWMVTRLTAQTSGFRADFTETLHLSELARLREHLQQMYTDLHGSAELDAMDGFLELKAEMDRLGHILWSVELRYPAGWGARLQFEIANDQTYLPDLLAQLDAVLDEWPIVGERPHRRG